jgi:hypothetical protein
MLRPPSGFRTRIFVYEPGGVIGSHDHACFEAQQRIGKRPYDHTVSMKASRRIHKRWACISMFPSVDSRTASDRSLRGVKQRVFSVGRGGWHRGSWCTTRGQ